MRNDRLDKLYAYKFAKQAWIDQAILALGADVCTKEERELRIAAALRGAFTAGRDTAPPPEPINWSLVLHNKYVKPHYGVMRLAGQTVPDCVPTQPRRIIRRFT